MHLIPLQPPSESQARSGGDVTLHPSAVVAAGALILAEADSRVAIAAGACIGMGAVLHAVGGEIVVAAGANLGAGVLIVGTGRIGSNACIGAATTILNPAVGDGEMVPPGSLITGSTPARAPSTSSPGAIVPAAPTGPIPGLAQLNRLRQNLFPSNGQTALSPVHPDPDDD
ncbi:2,3,4,5-tetrahydropyridine-2,6-dicarboxylate N-acetyltransferase [Gloeobacter kilaueensis]|uniref:2,3,4,5-tetrahydropyridine-2,6-dicarboxylate N-acetyltransferase n=1 Tax=Gloeobacter kilaueensis (strain ATCC BAA-2537 / CCAP 1431/1 / ULC 316 / JS1) TaxID=1183438 RepID=U5QDA6_GLOK1|nr:2,3,4,5-tetrahydropyridine-2,6-dicarboxylate N-acetyltransferase [Gloeobacter kilaueensis]AGY56907.1 2,3,4,5-tetrahydropyridine-2,6-dicarboxylate N-acetyltransferase [Gloeobacter kilaueensis JS1]